MRDCPNKSRHSARFQHFVDLGTAAAFFLDNENGDLEDDDLGIMSLFTTSEKQLASANEIPEDDAFFTWVCDLLDDFDDSSSHFVDERDLFRSPIHCMQHSIPELADMMSDFICYSSGLVNEHVLLNTGAPRFPCSKNWLRKSNWSPLKEIALGPGTVPFSFSEHLVQPLYTARFAAHIQDICGQVFYLKICAYILPSNPIPFLFGLVDQRSLGFDICLRNGNASYLKINYNRFDSTFPVIVSSHVWLRFQPVNKLFLDDAAWTEAMNCSIEENSSRNVPSHLPTQLFFMNEHVPGSSDSYLAHPGARTNGALR